MRLAMAVHTTRPPGGPRSPSKWLADYLEPGREALAIIDRVTFMFEGVRDSEIPDIHSPPTRKAVEQAVGSWLQRREADLSAPLFEMPG